jgi:hypothetical protein
MHLSPEKWPPKLPCVLTLVLVVHCVSRKTLLMVRCVLSFVVYHWAVDTVYLIFVTVSSMTKDLHQAIPSPVLCCTPDNLGYL